MVALSILAPRGAALGSTQLEYGVVLRPSPWGEMRKRRWSMADMLPFGKCCSGHSLPGCSSEETRTTGFRHGFSSGLSCFRFLKSCGPRRRYPSNSFALALAFEEETVVSLDEGEEAEKNKGAAFNEEDAKTEKELVSGGNRKRIDVRELARSLWHCRTADCVEEVFNNLDELPPSPVFSSLIKGLGIDNKLESAFALVDWFKMRKNGGDASIGPSLFVYNSLLGALKQTREFGEVDRVMEDMAAQGLAPNVVTYNSLMSLYIEQGQHSEALDVLVRIDKEGLSPSPVTYSMALLAYWRMEDALGALGLYVGLRDKYQKGEMGKDVDEDWEDEISKITKFIVRICCQVMRQWLVKVDDPTNRIMKLLIEMDKAKVSPGRVECEKLIWACTQEGHYVVVRELYERVREMDSGVSLSVCNHVIWLMGKAKKWWAALEVYEELMDRGPKPNNLSYELIMSHFNILLSAASKKGIWRWGVRLINKMKDKGLRPGIREWNAVLVACSKASETAATVQIFRRIIEEGEKPTILSYGALLSALEKGNLYDEAISVWEHMCKVGVSPNLYAYTILASIYIGKGEPENVDSIIHRMVSSGIEPTVVTFNAIISSCARRNLSSDAFEWFQRMKGRNIAPNKITYEMLVEVLAQNAKPRLAFELYTRAQIEGLDLSSKAYDAVLESCRMHGASVDLSLMGPRPLDKKKIVKTRKTVPNF